MYEAISMQPSERHEIMMKPGFLRALNKSVPTLNLVLQQNVAVNIFSDDMQCFATEELPIGHKSEKVTFFNTFVDLAHSKNRKITAVDWCPNRSDVVAVCPAMAKPFISVELLKIHNTIIFLQVSCAENRSFDERVDLSSTTQQSAVLIWNFSDLIHPEYILHAPDEV